MRSAHAEKFEDPAETPLPERPQRFSIKQTEFLHAFAASPYMSERALCREVGIRPAQITRWKKESANFKRAMQTEYRRSQLAANMNRKTVLNGMLKAIELAEDLGQPSSMITGWKEVARMCGYYEPERREILLSVDSKNLLEQIQSLPKNKLLELWHEHEAVDGEFEVITPNGEKVVDAP
jgi:hypothetical protein